jgi:hypothetical protein
MNTIADLTSRHIEATGTVRLKAEVTTLSALIPCGDITRPSALYEIEMFNFLLRHKDALGIQSVIRFKNLVLDGSIILTDGRRLVIDAKMRMNWLKACQSECQFRQFLKRPEAKTIPVGGAIIFFEEFSGDWNKKAKKAKNLWGWEGWYLDHCNAVDGKRMDLLMLSKGVLQGYPL